jgi:Tol biopolymer transport system component
VVDGQRDIWTLSVPDGQPEPFTDDPAMDTNPAFAPDGSKLAFVSDRSGTDRVWIAEFAGGEMIGDPFMVTTGDQTDRFPDWSPDGTQLAFIRDGDVWVTRVEPGQTARRLTDGANATIARWETSGKSLLVSGSWETQQVHLRRVSAGDGVSAPHSPPVVFGDASATGLFDASRDLKAIAYVETATAGDVWLMEEATED